MSIKVNTTRVEPVGPLSMAAIAHEMGISRAQVYNIYNSALGKLKEGLEERGYDIEDLEHTLLASQEPTELD